MNHPECRLLTLTGLPEGGPDFELGLSGLPGLALLLTFQPLDRFQKPGRFWFAIDHGENSFHLFQPGHCRRVGRDTRAERKMRTPCAGGSPGIPCRGFGQIVFIVYNTIFRPLQPSLRGIPKISRIFLLIRLAGPGSIPRHPSLDTPGTGKTTGPATRPRRGRRGPDGETSTGLTRSRSLPRRCRISHTPRCGPG